jgi:hypothetical protein
MHSFISLVRSSVAKAFGVASIFAVTLLALSFGSGSAEAGGPVLLKRANIAALNPQPLPPRWITIKNLPRPGGPVYLNPQPLPPRWLFISPYQLRLK